MRRLILTLALLLAAVSASAQISAGIGYSHSRDMTKIGTDGDFSLISLNGFTVGANYSLPIVEGLSFVPGLYYEFLAAAGAKEVSEHISMTGSLIEHYLQLPLTLQFGGEVARSCRLFVFGGPTLSLGLASTRTESLSVPNFISLGGKHNQYEDGDYGRFDLMVGGGAGVDIYRIRVTVGYDWGLLNRNLSDDGDIRHRGHLLVGVGWVF